MPSSTPVPTIVRVTELAVLLTFQLVGAVPGVPLADPRADGLRTEFRSKYQAVEVRASVVPAGRTPGVVVKSKLGSDVATGGNGVAAISSARLAFRYIGQLLVTYCVW